MLKNELENRQRQFQTFRSSECGNISHTGDSIESYTKLCYAWIHYIGFQREGCSAENSKMKDWSHRSKYEQITKGAQQSPQFEGDQV